MATANIKDDDDEEIWNGTDDHDSDDHEFFDAPDIAEHHHHSSTTSKPDVELLHQRLNSQLSTDDQVKAKSPEDPYFIDEDPLIEGEKLFTEEEKEKRHADAQKLKDEGNERFGQNEFDQALAKYSEALVLCPMKFTKDRAVIYANRAACLMKMEKYEAAIQSCTKSIEFDATYLKPLVRRAESYKQIEKFDEALQDYQKILELDPNHQQARREVHILPEQIKERNEKMKAEMLDKLKELGNMVLKPFGLSTNNFKLQQDPSTGSYSVNFQK